MGNEFCMAILTSWNPSSDEIIFMYSSNLHGHGSSFVFKIKIYLY